MNKKFSLLNLRTQWSEVLQVYCYSLAVSAIFIGLTLEPQKYDYINGFLENLGTYFSVSVNALIVLAVGVYIGFLNYVLERTFPWLEKGFMRLAVQVVLGGIVSGFITYGLAYIYYSIMPTVTYSDSYYFKVMFPVAMGLIVAANIYFWYAGPRGQVFYEKNMLPKYDRPSTGDEIQNRAPIPAFELPSDVLTFYALSNMIYYMTEDQSVRYLPFSLIKVMSVVDRDDYFRINRSCILHRKVIERIRKVPNTRHWEVLVKPEFLNLMKVELDIPRDLVKDAVSWFKKDC